MKSIDPDLSFEEVRNLFNYYDGKLYWRVNRGSSTMGDEIGHITALGYRRTSVKKKYVFVHRLIWLYHYKEWPVGEIDHINRDRLDNRIENLRISNRSQNIRNSPIKGVSKYRGVSKKQNRAKWVAQAQHDKKRLHIGSFKTEEDAAFAWNLWHYINLSKEDERFIVYNTHIKE